jgi:hypothetical protein
MSGLVFGHIFWRLNTILKAQSFLFKKAFNNIFDFWKDFGKKSIFPEELNNNF